MKRFCTLIAAAAMVSGLGTAWAASELSGTIKSVDAATRQLTLSDGQTYSVAIDVPMTGLKPGDQVITSSYENFGNNEVLILNE